MATRVYTYDRAEADGGPYVPDVDDLGGEIEDDAQNPPAGDEPSGQLYNERRDNIAGINRCIWWCTLWVEYSAPDYVMTAVDAMATPTRVTSASFTPTPSGTGVVVITWAAGTLPPMARTPHVWLTDSHGAQPYAAVTGANEITIHLANTSGVAADRSFAVELR